MKTRQLRGGLGRLTAFMVMSFKRLVMMWRIISEEAVQGRSSDLLDVRVEKEGVRQSDSYDVKHGSAKHYDFVFVSAPPGGLAFVVDGLEADGISGALLLA